MLDDLKTGAGFNSSNFVSQTGGIYAVPVPLPVPAVTLKPSTLIFAGRNTGTVSPPQDVSWTNFGQRPARYFEDRRQRRTSPKPTIVAPAWTAGSKCTIGVTYEPRKTGKENPAPLTISDNAFTGTQTVSLWAEPDRTDRQHRARRAELPAAGDQNHQRPSVRAPDQFGHRSL